MATITSPRPTSPSSSSVRASIDSARGSVISVSTTANSSAPQPIRRGNRAALRDYYNLKNKPASTPQRTASIASNISTGTTATNTSATLLPDANSTTSSLTAALDEPDFDPDSFVANLLESANLRHILKTEATLVSEIRNLDGERKALVYDNYSKLIGAVSVMGKLQREMEQEEGLKTLGALKGKMDGLLSLTENIMQENEVGEKERIERTERIRRRQEEKDQEKEQDNHSVTDLHTEEDS